MGERHIYTIMLKLHLGCGQNILDDYVNIDMAPSDNKKVEHLDILSLPYKDTTVDEILAEHLAEHLSFDQEKSFWKECYRVLKPDGILTVETPDFEWVCTSFLQANEGFDDFYQVGADAHYFGHGQSLDHRWGILSTHFFGNQNGEGQFHRNAYTEKKMTDISRLVGFRSGEIDRFYRKDKLVMSIRGTFAK